MNEYVPYLVKTSFYEIATYVDELKFYEEYYISSQDKKELEENNEIPSEYYTIGKIHFAFQDSDDYSIIIKRMDGTKSEIKSIDILSEGNIEDEDERIYGIENFLMEYYEKNMPKNSFNDIYYYYKYED